MAHHVQFEGWIPVALSNVAEAGAATRAVVNGEDLVIWRGRDDVVRVWENRCPHRGMRLSYGIVRGNRLTCIYHGWVYDGEGSCAAIPAHTDLTPPKTIKVQKYQSLESGGMIWVSREAATPLGVEGDWTPCRTLHVSSAAAKLSIALGKVAARRIHRINDFASKLELVDGHSLLVGMHQMTTCESMLHCSVLAAAPPGALRAASLWLNDFRKMLERIVPYVEKSA